MTCVITVTTYILWDIYCYFTINILYKFQTIINHSKTKKLSIQHLISVVIIIISKVLEKYFIYEYENEQSFFINKFKH